VEIDPRVSKLPVWARNLIVSLTRQVEHLEGENRKLSGPLVDCWRGATPGIYRDALNATGFGLLLPDRMVTVVGDDPKRTILDVQFSKYGISIRGREALNIRPEASNSFRVVAER
jgi:hypothetical protein